MLTDASAGMIKAKAVIYSGSGGYDVVTVGTRTVRKPNAGEVRVKVAAAAINPTDVLLRDLGYGNIHPPITPGMDVAGIIESIGEGVTEWSIGDEVMGVVSPVRPEGGAQAAFVIVPEASVVLKPSGLTFAQAATLPMNGLTALYALEQAALLPGSTLGVTGGAGWLAYQTIALAKLRGLRIIADARADEFDLVRSYGADTVVERGSNFCDAVRQELSSGVDALLDTALLAEEALPAIKDHGIYIPVRGSIQAESQRNIRIVPVLVTEVLHRTDWLKQLHRHAEAKHILPKVAAEYEPEQIVEAQKFLVSGGVRGRPILSFDPNV